jgi:hypothetical protein
VDQAIVLDLAPLPHRNHDSFVTRNRVWNAAILAPQWLTVPVLRNGQSVKDTWINDTDKRWISRHIHGLQHCYPKHQRIASGFLDELESILQSGHSSLLSVNLDVTAFLLRVLGQPQSLPQLESGLGLVHSSRHRQEIVERLGATSYIAGSVEWKLIADTKHDEDSWPSKVRLIKSPESEAVTQDIESVVFFSAAHAICTQGVAQTSDLLAELLSKVSRLIT